MAKRKRNSGVGDRSKMYSPIIESIFKDHYKPGLREFTFERREITKWAKRLRIKLPGNLGDLIYSFKFRKALPESIRSTCTEGEHWVIVGAGRSVYRFKLVAECWILPRANMYRIKIPDATPEIIEKYALTDEQAVLAKVRYNRLIDVFLGVVAYSLQNHLRTFVKEIGQIEIDELYVGLNKKGEQFVIPVQAKTGKDKIGIVQAAQDVSYCAKRFPSLVCKPIAVHFMADDVIAMFELRVTDTKVEVVEEKHYVLVPADSITDQDLSEMARLK